VSSDPEFNFRKQVEALVSQIPRGRVMTYGQISALCGRANAARVVGGIAHFGDPNLPWQRVVNKQGSLASGYPGGRQGHKQVIESEGIKVSPDYLVDVKKLIWWPSSSVRETVADSAKLKASSQNFSSPPLIVIVGETASGKSALAMLLAKEFGGEIIAADSRTIYKGMDIGTAKPSKADQSLIPHHMLDISTPDKPLTVAEYKEKAEAVIDDISARGKIPILVGGSGLYIDAVVFNFKFRPVGDPKSRQALAEMSVESLQKRLKNAGIPLPNNALNPRHLIRAIESGGKESTREPLRPSILMLGFSLDQSQLKGSIAARVELMLKAGLEGEVRKLVHTYGWTSALQTIGYQEFESYFAGQKSIEETKSEIIRNTLAYAKRQRTWFKRNNSIRWVKQRIETVDLVTTHLNKYRS
jgi:tRNA dimethylallyltransferase